MKIPDNFAFSQHNLQDYVDCPRRFELRYLKKLAWPAIQSEPVLAIERHMQLGERFHRMVQQHQSGLPADVVGVLMHEVSHGERKTPEDLEESERRKRRPELRPGERARSFFTAKPRSRGASEGEPENHRAHDEGKPVGRRSDEENQASRPGHLAHEGSESRKRGDAEGDSRSGRI